DQQVGRHLRGRDRRELERGHGFASYRPTIEPLSLAGWAAAPRSRTLSRRGEPEPDTLRALLPRAREPRDRVRDRASVDGGALPESEPDGRSDHRPPVGRGVHDPRG